MLRRRQDRLKLCLGWILLLAGCAAPALAPPEQQQDSHSLRHAFDATSREAASQIIADIGPLEGGRFRWTGANPQVRLALDRTEGLRLQARFWIAAEALRGGPVEVSLLANGHEVARANYTAEGEQSLEGHAPAAALHRGANEASLAISRTFQQNGRAYGVPLAELGFVD